MFSATGGVLLTAVVIATAQRALALGLAQGPAGISSIADDGQLAFNNACRTCHTLREGDNRLGPNCITWSAARPDRCRATAIPAP
jgi:cytochrome c2